MTGSEIDERALEAACAAYLQPVEGGGFVPSMRHALAAYEATKPVAPMGASGEMVEELPAKLREIGGIKIQNWRQHHRTIKLWAAEAASRIEALEAIVAEQAGEIEHYTAMIEAEQESCRYWCGEAAKLNDRARIAEAALAAPAGMVEAGRFTIEYDNDTGPDDGGFWEWWSVLENGNRIAKCDSEADAKRIVAALSSATDAKDAAEVTG